MINISEGIASLYKGKLGFTIVGEVVDEESFKRNVKFVVGEKDGVAIFGNSDQSVNWEAVKNELSRLQAVYDSTQYQRDRKAEYDKLNQFELIGEDAINGTTNHKDAILAIKAKHPKEQ